MASEHVIVSQTITKAVAEATRVAIQTMATAAAERPQSTAGPKIVGPAKKQPTFNWEVEDKYSKLKTFKLEVQNTLMTYRTPMPEQLAMVIKLAR